MISYTWRHLQPRISHTYVIHVIVYVLLATNIVISFPPYLEAINAKSDVYCAVFFTALCSFIVIFIVVVVLKLYNREMCCLPPFSYLTVWRLGTCLGLSIVLIYLARDRNRVACHLQDPLAAIVLPISIIFHYARTRKVDSTRKLFCLAAAIIGLFISIDYQIWDEFSCHGHPNMTDESKIWSRDDRIIWTCTYVAGLALFSLWLVLLDKELKSDKPECQVSTIPLTRTISSIPKSPDVVIDDADEALIPANQRFNDVDIDSLKNYEKLTLSLSKCKVWVLALWIQMSTLCTVVFFVWLDSIAKRDILRSTTSMLEGIKCHFSAQEGCDGVVYVSWPFIASSPLFLVSFISLLNSSRSCSIPYLVAALMIAFPLSTIFWSIVKMNVALQWSSAFSGEAGFALVGLPILVLSIAFYRHYTKLEIDCPK